MSGTRSNYLLCAVRRLIVPNRLSVGLIQFVLYHRVELHNKEAYHVRADERARNLQHDVLYHYIS